MPDQSHLLESATPFAESLIWQLNRQYYEHHGIEAWRSQKVPHQVTSNSMVGMTYAELIFGIMKDVARKIGTDEKLYILELGAGHGRLAYHVLIHLNRLIDKYHSTLPSFCYIVSDFTEDNLKFFSSHPQFQKFFDNGTCDVAHFDAIDGQDIHLRHADVSIRTGDLNNPLITIANYFFDSIPADLFHIQNGQISNCSVSLHTEGDTGPMNIKETLKDISIEIQEEKIKFDHYDNSVSNKVLNDYRTQLFDTYLLFPKSGIGCLDNLNKLSQSGIILLTMDKGQHELSEMENAPIPDVVNHGSMSVEVNFHALSAYCQAQGGSVKFSDYATLHLQLGCFIFAKDAPSYSETWSSYDRFVNNHGPDVFNGMKRFSYKHIASMDLVEIIGMIRMGHFDSTVFIKLLPQIKLVIQRISRSDRKRLAQTMHNVWKMYFTLNEDSDLAFEIGGIFYALAYYKEALDYFDHSISTYGNTTDEYYNRILCYYQLRRDEEFEITLKEGKIRFPNFQGWAHLDRLDLGAK